MDSVLDGGYEKDAITTIYGPSGVGKTNLALLCALNTAKTKKVIFIDTEGGYSIERLKQLDPDYLTLLDNIMFLKPTSFTDQKAIFEKLSELINDKIGLIIIDTISMLYRFELANDDAVSLNRELGKQLKILTEIVRIKNIPVLITNQVYSSIDAGPVNLIRQVGGDVIRYSSKCLIELKLAPRGRRRFILRKHRSIGGEKTFDFEIVSTGIEEIKQKSGFKLF